MGSGIAQVAATAGIYTSVFDLNPHVLAAAEKNITGSLDKLVARNRLSTGERDSILARLRFTNDIHSCLADFFIEAIIEKPEAKIALFNQLAEINHSECIFATNTSSLPVTEIAKAVQNPERVIGMHFFNPAPLMKLVEIVRTEYTNQLTADVTTALAAMFDKIAVQCQDSPGFIVNRVARPFYIESLRLAEEGVPYETIDNLLEATGFRMGPFRLMDLIGNDINYAVSCSVYQQLGNPERLKPSHLQQDNVEKGRLGKKTNAGFYNYEDK